jgi:Tol biopolymer transport system component
VAAAVEDGPGELRDGAPDVRRRGLTPAISPDGNLIAYASDRDGSFSLYLRQFGARQAIRLTGPESRDWYPCFSPDGLRLVYRSERDGGGLYVRDALGGPSGAEMKLVDGGAHPSFAPDGATIAYLRPAALTGQARLFLISAGGGAPRPPHRPIALLPSPGGHSISALVAGWGEHPSADAPRRPEDGGGDCPLPGRGGGDIST